MKGNDNLTAPDTWHEARKPDVVVSEEAFVKPQGPISLGLPTMTRWQDYVMASVAGVALVMAVLLWQRLGQIQEQLAKQSAETSGQAQEARTLARQASELARETAARVAVIDVRLSEVALQRGQLDELIQSLSRSRDENLVVDIESAVRLAQQQAQMTGSAQPLVAALKTADLRVQRAAQPRLAALARAINKDLARIQSSAMTDTPALLVKLDELVRLIDELPLGNAVGPQSAAIGKQIRTAGPATKNPQEPEVDTFSWQKLVERTKAQAFGLLRVSRVEAPEAAILSPEQSFFVRENLKLTLLNARLGLLARQLDASRADLASASASLQRYFLANSPKTQVAAALMQQVQSQMRTVDLPRVDETLGALTTAAAGR